MSNRDNYVVVSYDAKSKLPRDNKYYDSLTWARKEFNSLAEKKEVGQVELYKMPKTTRKTYSLISRSFNPAVIKASGDTKE